MITIYDSLSGEKRPLHPIEPGRVKLYVCGVTAYDFCHLGHARVMVVFDVVVRYLRQVGYEVTYVRNITDVDDKIIDRANDLGEGYDELTQRFIAAMHEDGAALGLLKPDLEPRATVHMPQIIDMIRRLIDGGYAYVGRNGDVYYDVSRFPDYGRLSGRRPEALRAGARVEVDEAKADPLDFVLWKPAKADEPAWDSPWGPGRPGWHIECSAMSTHCLGNRFDIHGGGVDLKFPHHENEIAQSEAATGETFVGTWMHVGFIQVDDEKMAKSLGNFVTIRDVIQRYPAEALRYYLLTSHYRSPLDYTDAQMQQALSGLRRLHSALRGLPDAPADPGPYADRFRQVMDDDFNTPRALSVLFDMARDINKLRAADQQAAARLGAGMRQLAAPLGLLQQSSEAFLRQGSEGLELSVEAIEALIDERAQARRRRDFARADEIRDRLASHGVHLEDTAQGTLWRLQ